jgi:hypothetical protein
LRHPHPISFAACSEADRRKNRSFSRERQSPPGRVVDDRAQGKQANLAAVERQSFSTRWKNSKWRLPDVLAYHADTVKVLHTLRPFAVAMAGEGEFDPFKD